MTLRGRWLMKWQDYPSKFMDALRGAAEGPYTVLFASSREAQSFKVRMQKMGRGILADPGAPDWMKKAAEDVAWGVVRQTKEGYTVTGAVRKPRYLTVEQLEREMVEFNQSRGE